jgi:tRNA-splicing ligase RtcB
VSAAQLGRELAGVFWDHRRARVLVDEAPSAYKDIGKVMRVQRELVRIVRKLEPILAFKGG